MSSYDYDLLVIGAGSAGVRAARVAANLGARVAICEERALGGTCVNVGCVPKKLMVYGAHFADEVHAAPGFGWSVAQPSFDWSKLIANKDREIARLNGVYQTLLESKGVRVIRGHATVSGPHEAEVHALDGQTLRLSARYQLIAVGGRPQRPAFPGAEHVLVSDDVFRLKDLPRRLLIIGGGYIAVEFAGIFSGYGASVTQVYRGALFLRGFDRDVRTHLDYEMRKKGIDLRFRCDVKKIERVSHGLAVTLDDDSTIEVDAVLAAVGREPLTQGLGLEQAGVLLDQRGAIKVDEAFRTSLPGVYAVGDVIDRVQLTPVALAEGMLVARNLFGGEARRADYDYIPSAVFSNPPIGTVGLTEEEARQAYGSVDIFKQSFTPMKQTLGGGSDKTLMKLVVDQASQRVVGVHMVGPDAGEILQGFAVALKCGATKQAFDSTIGIHPTAAEELVTMREQCPDPDHGLSVEHKQAGPRKAIVNHRWDGEGS